MVQTPSSFYANWRGCRDPWPSLREEPPTPPERLLQLVWYHQRLKRGELTAQDGRKIRVLHPGFWNREAGPDFRGAVIQFDGGLAQSGDVEIDVLPGGWHQHKHDRNPNFEKVLLHVIWDGIASADKPTL